MKSERTEELNDIEKLIKKVFDYYQEEGKEKEEESRYVIVRAARAGVFAGYLFKHNKDEVVLKNCRRLWHWEGAASLSQLAMDGTSKPENCKFPCEVSTMWISGVIEILQTSEKAKKSIKEVTVWKK